MGAPQDVAHSVLVHAFMRHTGQHTKCLGKKRIYASVRSRSRRTVLKKIWSDKITKNSPKTAHLRTVAADVVETVHAPPAITFLHEEQFQIPTAVRFTVSCKFSVGQLCCLQTTWTRAANEPCHRRCRCTGRVGIFPSFLPACAGRHRNAAEHLNIAPKKISSDDVLYRTFR